jgi:peptidoglycan hydrolase-like protein with peptidoglycan-binding domain
LFLCKRSASFGDPRLPVTRIGRVSITALIAVILVSGGVLVSNRPAAAADHLDGGQTLGTGDKLYSPSGQFVLIMQGDGNLVEYFWPRALWSSNTSGAYATLEMQEDGNLVAYRQGHIPMWSTNTGGNPGAYAALQDDGNLTVIARDGRALWANGVVHDRLIGGETLRAGWAIQSPDRKHRLAMQSDGNVVVYSGSTVRWSSKTFKTGSTLEMQSDGNLVVYAPGHLAVWATGTNSRSNATLVGQDDGNFVLYAPGNVAVWSTRTNRITSAVSTNGSMSGCPTMRQGSAGPCVALLQRTLNLAGVQPRLIEDGFYGSLTTQEVRDFQAGHGIVADGVAGPQTRSALINATSVATPRPGPPASYPSEFSPSRAAAWARANAGTRESDQTDTPCTQFVSRALHGGGMPYDGDWYPKTVATPVDKYIHPPEGVVGAWYNVQQFKNRLLNRGWVSITRIYPGTRVSAALGDIIYYEWNGVASNHEVHLAIVTGANGSGNALVTDQTSRTKFTPSRQWDLSGVQAGKPLTSVYGTDMRAYVLHWR